MERPNLFKFATSELSQDAFLCWLISWAKPENHSADTHLHEAGKALLAAFFEKKGIELPEIESIEVHKQYKNIDVLVLVNEEYAVIIEDKIRTKNHSGQLSRYFDGIVKLGYPKDKIVPIYFKTWYQDHYDTGQFKPFLLNDLLEVLKKGEESDHPIFRDYFEFQSDRQKKVDSFNEKPIAEWKEGWVGFFLKLQEILDEKAKWKYIPNQSGGYYGFYWNFRKPKHETTRQIYLQLNQMNGTAVLHFKIQVPESNHRREAKWYWLEQFKTEGDKLGLPIKKVPRFGSGLHMSVAELDMPVVRQDPTTHQVDFDYTLKYMEKCQRLIEKAKQY